MDDATLCTVCGTELAPGLLACPGCQRLIYGERLRELAASAEQAAQSGDLQAALIAWREALELLPSGSRQYDQIAGRIRALGQQIESRAALKPQRAPFAKEENEDDAHNWGKAGVAGAGAVGLFLFKFKFALFFLLAKAKFLLVGLKSAGTFFSMLAYFGVYWARFGWQFGLGLVLSIYVHEMGHVFMLSRYGIKAGAPMFIPGFGAYVRLYQEMHDVRQDARVGLAGPAWGMGAAIGCFAASLILESPVLAAVAKMGALINLFNLIPIWQLDGGRAFRTLTRSERWLAAAAVAGLWAITEQPLLLLLVIGAAYRAACERGSGESDRGMLIEYIGLAAGFTALMMLPVGR